ncbi:MAG: peptidase U32 family protein [Desulfosudaceae bacterium]
MPARAEKVELLAPAGNYEKLEIAVHYGADAVYLGDPRFSLRHFADNFTVDQLYRAAELLRAHGVKMYVACNIFPDNREAAEIGAYLAELAELSPDAVIIADPGVLLTARQTIPRIPVHLSTQANTTNLQSVRFWAAQGVRRINLAREMSLAEIREITRNCSVDIEAFVHGSVCISYSGRCLLSRYLDGRDSNRGRCSHPCRWQYHLLEEKRPGQYLPVAEDRHGTYIFNARDLCMIDHLDRMIAAGITSLKIEGRMKSIHYLASTVKVYREAIDAYYRDPDRYRVDDAWRRTLAAVNSRGYSTHFYLGTAGAADLNETNEKPPVQRTFVAKVLHQDKAGDTCLEIRNKLFRRDRINILRPGCPDTIDTIDKITDAQGVSLEHAQPNSVVTVRLRVFCRPHDLIQRLEGSAAGSGGRCRD